MKLRSFTSSKRNPALLIIAGCFALSAIARVAELDLATAMATAEELAAPSAANDRSDESASEILARLREREIQLEARREQLDERARVIEAAEVSLREQLAALEEAEARLSSLVQVADTAADQDVDMLVAAFQNMDGKRAAPIFENMDTAFAAGLIARMGEAAAADILGALTPEKAYSITVNIASRNAGAPRE